MGSVESWPVASCSSSRDRRNGPAFSFNIRHLSPFNIRHSTFTSRRSQSLKIPVRHPSPFILRPSPFQDTRLIHPSPPRVPSGVLSTVMQRSTRRLLAILGGLVVFTIGSALLYKLGMLRLEGEHRSIWQSIEWAAETLSTTGYGADSKWNHPVMVLFVVGVQFVGVFLFFLVVPIFMVPFLEERFEEKLPRRAPEKLADHGIVYRFGPAVETLLGRLSASGVASLVVETDEGTARAVHERGQGVVFVRAEEDALEVSRLGNARALVANGRDEENAALVLRARQMGFRGDVLAFVEEPAHRKPMELAGATAAFTPRHIVAAG